MNGLDSTPNIGFWSFPLPLYTRLSPGARGVVSSEKLVLPPLSFEKEEGFEYSPFLNPGFSLRAERGLDSLNFPPNFFSPRLSPFLNRFGESPKVFFSFQSEDLSPREGLPSPVPASCSLKNLPFEAPLFVAPSAFLFSKGFFSAAPSFFPKNLPFPESEEFSFFEKEDPLGDFLLLAPSPSCLSEPKNGFLGLFFFMLLQHHCCRGLIVLTF